MLPPGVCVSTGTEMAYALSSTRKITGRRFKQAVPKGLEEFAFAGHALAAGNQHHLVTLVADELAEWRALRLRQRAGELLVV